MIPLSTMQAYRAEAQQFRKKNSLYAWNRALWKHFSIKVPHRIRDLIVFLGKQIFPSLAITRHPPSQITGIQVISNTSSTWKDIAQLTEALIKKAGISFPIYSCTSSSQESEVTTWENCIIFTENVRNYSQKQQEFIIMHELMHIHFSHLSFRLKLSLFFLVADLFFLFYFSPLAIFPIEILAFYIESVVCSYQEKQADLAAINQLGSNTGAIELYQERIDTIYPIDEYKHLPIEQQQELRKIQQIACNYSAVTHPSFTQRLIYCTRK